MQCVLLKILVAQHIKNGKTGCTGNGIAAKRAKELHAIIEGSGDFRRRDDSGKRETVGDGFAKDEDVGDDILRFEAPEMRAKASEADLDFIGYANPAGRAHVLVDLGQVPRRKNDLAGNTG